MKRGIMILLSILILIVGIWSVYAAGEPIGVPTAPPPPQTAAQEPTTVQIMQIKPEHQGSTIFVYDVSAQKVDRYVETEKGKLKYVDSAPYTLEKWRDFASQGDPDYLSNPMTSEEANTELMKRGATPKPQVTPAPQATQPPVQALVQPPAAETKHEDPAGKDINTKDTNLEKAKELNTGSPASPAKAAETSAKLSETDAAYAQAEKELQAAWDAYDPKKPTPETEKAWKDAVAKYNEAEEKKRLADVAAQDAQIELKKKEDAAKEAEAAGKMSPEEAAELGAEYFKVRAEETAREKKAMSVAQQDAELAQSINSLEKEEDALKAEIADAQKKGLDLTVKEKEEALAQKVKDRKAKEKERDALSEAQVDYGKNLQMIETMTADIERLEATLEKIPTRETVLDLEKKLSDAQKRLEEDPENPENFAAVQKLTKEIQQTTAELENTDQADIDFLNKSKADKEKQRNELEEKGENLRMHNEITLINQEIAKDRADLAKAVEAKDADEIKRLEEKIAQEEAQKEKKQDDLLWRERSWSARTVFLINEFMQGYEEYQGIGQWSSLVLSDEDLTKRRQRAAEKFCNDIWLLAGTKCWQSRLCEMWYPREAPVAQNTLVTEVGIGGYLPAASIQADKSFPMPYMEAGKTKTMHTYKITYIMENPLDVGLTYHIELRGDRTFKSDERILERKTMEKSGGKEGRLGSDPLIFDSEYNYESACLVFSPRIMNSNGGYVNEICSPITQYSGAATKPYTLPADTLAAVQNSTGTSTGVSMTGA